MSKICNDSYIEYCDHQRMFFNALKRCCLLLFPDGWMDGWDVAFQGVRRIRYWSKWVGFVPGGLDIHLQDSDIGILFPHAKKTK